ncbi:MAG: fluoride efflux transporter CrcB [Woeseia sp.]
MVALSYLFVGAGGALGAMARFALNVALQRSVSFPWGTLSANLLGCLLMGVIAQLVASSSWFNSAGIIPDQYRLLFAVGFCGSFTTLSALVMELHTMLQRNELLASFSYLVVSVVGGFACFYAGFMLLRSIRGYA